MKKKEKHETYEFTDDVNKWLSNAHISKPAENVNNDDYNERSKNPVTAFPISDVSSEKSSQKSHTSSETSKSSKSSTASAKRAALKGEARCGGASRVAEKEKRKAGVSAAKLAVLTASGRQALSNQIKWNRKRTERRSSPSPPRVQLTNPNVIRSQLVLIDKSYFYLNA